MADFNEALSSLMPPELKDSFETIQNEQAAQLNKESHEIRFEPSPAPNPVKWSLSSWSDLRLNQLFPTERETSMASQQDPVEIEEMKSLFPDFATSYQRDN